MAVKAVVYTAMPLLVLDRPELASPRQIISLRMGLAPASAIVALPVSF
jgi:hypothetical protein